MSSSPMSEIDSVAAEIETLLDIDAGLRFGVSGVKVWVTYAESVTHLRNTAKKAEEVLQDLIADADDEEVITKACLKLRSGCQFASIYTSTEWMNKIDQSAWKLYKVQHDDILASLVKLRSDNQTKMVWLWIVRGSVASVALGVFAALVLMDNANHKWFNTLAALPTSSLWKALDESLLRRLDEKSGFDKTISSLMRVASILTNGHASVIQTFPSARTDTRITITGRSGEVPSHLGSGIRSWFSRLWGSASE